MGPRPKTQVERGAAINILAMGLLRIGIDLSALGGKALGLFGMHLLHTRRRCYAAVDSTWLHQAVRKLKQKA